MNCWEFKNCPPQTYRHCPAYPDRGRECWKLDRTLCAAGTLDAGSLAEKVAVCRECEFYMTHIVGSLEKAPGPEAEMGAIEDGVEGGG